MKKLVIAAGLVIPLFFSSSFAASGESVRDQLAERGHPNTTMCSLAQSDLGLGRLPFVQFEQHGDREEDRKEAGEILQLLAWALVDSGVRYIGFEATKNWSNCRSRDPEYIYWRDHDDNWRYMHAKPVKYLSKLSNELVVDQRGSASEAYLLWSLGVVEQRLGRRKASLESFEKAYEILDDTDDPNDIMAFLLLPLIQHHLGEDGDAQKGQALLEEFAMISEGSGAEGNYLPLIKIAPIYPSSAFQSGIEGYVLLEFTVDAEGRVQDPIVVEESPVDVFGKAAIKAARSFRYVPRVLDGDRVPTAGVRNRITFEIDF